MGKDKFELNHSPATSNGTTNGFKPKFSKIDGDAFAKESNGSSTMGTVKVEPIDGDIDPKVEVKDKKKKKKEVKPMVGVFEVFRFSSCRERFLMIIGTLCAIAHGASMPVMALIFGNMSDAFINNDKMTNYINEVMPNITAVNANVTKASILEDPNKFIAYLYTVNLTTIADEMTKLGRDGILETMGQNALYYVYLGICVVVIGYTQMAAWQISALIQGQKIRGLLLQSILRQDIGWFDTHEVGELNTRLVDDVDQIEAGIGDKLSLFFQYFCAFIAGFLVGFVKGWQLTLVILSVSPLLAIAGGIMGRIASTMAKKELKAYAKAGAVAEEVISAIRTVTAFGGQKKESKRYATNLVDAKNFGIRKGWIAGIGMGSIYLVMFSSYALAFWYGSELVRNGDGYTAGSMLTVFFCVLIGAFSIGNASPHIQDFSNSRGAAYAVYNLIDQVSDIDSSSPEGIELAEVKGNIEFRDVHFTYPSRADVKILNGLNLKVSRGQTAALVGSSGCGKSTTIQLLQRFYDPQQGEVLIDGVNIRTMNIKWMRRHIGVVSQEPVLFGTTIAENIRYGRENVTMEEVEGAAKNANAHDFIMQLPKKYDTLVGERGAQLSGGQKQRIAIARALVRDPKILLLDEATSALDTESESTVQSALDKARMGRTTIVVAHRLSTIRTADYIAGFLNGVIKEQGTHSELMQIEGIYYQLVTSQTRKEEKGAGDDENDDEDVMIARPDKLRSSLTRQASLFKRTTSVTSAKSAKSDKAEELDDDDLKAESIKPDALRLMKMNSPEWPYIIGATIAAIVNGCIQPMFAFIFSEVLGVFAIVDMGEQRRKINLLCVMFVVIGVVAGGSMMLMNAMYARTGEFLTMRLRKMTFETIIKQEIAYFDDRRHTTGALCSRLATDASIVRGAAGSRIGYVVQSIAAIGLALVIGFIYSWQLTLLVLAFAPFTLLSGFIQMRVVQTRGGKSDPIEQAATHTVGLSGKMRRLEGWPPALIMPKKRKYAGNTSFMAMAMLGLASGTAINLLICISFNKIAVEAIENIRTVSTLTKEEDFFKKYTTQLDKVYSKRRKEAHIVSIAFSFSQSIIFFADAACFMFGAWLIDTGKLEYQNMFKVFFAIIFGAMAAGRAASFAPDYGKALDAAGRLFYLFDRVPNPDSSLETGSKLEIVDGSVNLQNVNFSYPTRPDITILKDVSLTVKPGQMVALVGSSGCGKSTIVQLIERFYNPISGTLSLDNHSLDSLHIQWLRSQVGIVSQEPVLFDCSIRENIAYGDNSREVSMDEIISAAKQANIHNFISTLPNGYETSAGDKGAQLSGGQKQRIAIARALIRNPKILLLDEATSALDTESEKVVQEALERAQEGRTSIVIAHRLSTIQNAHSIIVLKLGKVVEIGTHSQLMAQQGVYYKLNTASSLQH